MSDRQCCTVSEQVRSCSRLVKVRWCLKERLTAVTLTGQRSGHRRLQELHSAAAKLLTVMYYCSELMQLLSQQNSEQMSQH